jgi:hypothetical protein
MDQHLLSYYTGISIVVISHLYTLSSGGLTVHSTLNLLAALMIAYYFLHQEKYIEF